MVTREPGPGQRAGRRPGRCRSRLRSRGPSPFPTGCGSGGVGHGILRVVGEATTVDYICTGIHLLPHRGKPLPTFNLADLFEIAADTLPDRLAVVAGDVRRTYAELDERATRFANHLARRGHRPGRRTSPSCRGTGWSGWWRCSAASRPGPSRSTSTTATRPTSSPTCCDDGEVVALVAERALPAAGRRGPPGSAGPAPRRRPRGRHRERRPRMVPDRPSATRTRWSLPSPERDVRAALPATTATCSTRAAPRGRPRVSSGAARTCSSPRSAGGNPGGPPIATPERAGRRRRTRAREPWLVTSPLMHGNGQWNSLVPLLTGRGVVLWTGRSLRRRTPWPRSPPGGRASSCSSWSATAWPCRSSRRWSADAVRPRPRVAAGGHVRAAPSCRPASRPAWANCFPRPRSSTGSVRPRPARSGTHGRQRRGVGGRRGSPWGPTPPCSTTTCARCASGERRTPGPPGPRSPRLLERPGQDRGDVPHRRRRDALGDPRRPGPARRTTGRSRCSVAARPASTPAARRCTPRRWRWRSRPTPTSPTPSSSASPDERFGQRGRGRRGAPRRAASTDLDERPGPPPPAPRRLQGCPASSWCRRAPVHAPRQARPALGCRSRGDQQSRTATTER